jgi:hypothetical protein
VASRPAIEIALRLTLTLGLVAVIGVGAGCAPSLSTFQPAHVAPKGHLSAGAGFEAGVPIGAFSTVLDTAKDLSRKATADPPVPLTADEKWRILDAGVNLVLVTPSFGPHFGVNYTPIDRLEVGVRRAGSAWRGGVRYQILDHTTGPFDLTVGLGVSRFSYEFPISDQIPVLKLDDFSRWQFDVPALIGTSRDWFRVWIGPKFLFTSFDTRLRLVLPSETTVATFDGTAAFVGGQGGFAVGYRRLFLALELTMGNTFGTAHLRAGIPDPATPTTHDTKVSSFTVFPSLGLMGEF